MNRFQVLRAHQQGKTWAGAVYRAHLQAAGRLVSVVSRDGLRWETYEIFGKRIVFVSRAEVI